MTTVFPLPPSPRSRNSVSTKKNACERCRLSKVRCHFKTEGQKCRRCFESDKDCNSTTPAPRKPRRRTDARVTVLEKELAQVKGLLGKLHSANGRDEGSPLVQHSPVTNKDPGIGIDEISGMNTGFFSTPIATIEVIPGCLDTSLLGEEDARQLYLHFTQNCLPQYPLMVLHNINFDTLALSKPMVLLATIAAASAAGEPSLYQKLHKHLVHLIIEKVILNGGRNLELLESILVMEIWICPPDDLRLLNFYQWIHIAGTMALQLGLVNHPADIDASSDVLLVDGSCNEHNRIALTCYLICSSAALSLRRQKMLPFTPTLARYLETLRQSHEISDRRLVAWIDLQLIAEQTCDASKSISSARQVAFLTQQFDTWRNNLAFGLLNESLLMNFHFMRAKTIELAMRFGKNGKYLVPPYVNADEGQTMASEKTNTTALAGPRDWDIEIACIFIDSCHSLLTDFVACEVDSLRSCPTVTFARVVYACQALLVVDRLGIVKNTPHLSPSERRDTYSYTRDTLGSVERHLRQIAEEELKRKVPDKICRLLPYLVAALSLTPPSESQSHHAPTSAHGVWHANVPPGTPTTVYRSVQEDDATAAVAKMPPPARRKEQQSQRSLFPWNTNMRTDTIEVFDPYTTPTSALTLDFNLDNRSAAPEDCYCSSSMSMFDLDFPFASFGGSDEQIVSCWNLPSV